MQWNVYGFLYKQKIAPYKEEKYEKKKNPSPFEEFDEWIDVIGLNGRKINQRIKKRLSFSFFFVWNWVYFTG